MTDQIPRDRRRFCSCGHMSDVDDPKSREHDRESRVAENAVKAAEWEVWANLDAQVRDA